MFAVIYRAYIKTGYESEYQKLWHKIATYFVEKRGALGSCLHKTEEGLWVAYSRWPDKATRDAAWPGEAAPSDVLPEEIKHAIVSIKDCFDPDQKFPDICMDVIEDLLLESI